MLGFIYQLLIFFALLITLLFQRNWRDRWFLFSSELISILTIDALLIGMSFLFIKNNWQGLKLLNFLFLWLPVIAPVLTWIYVEKVMRNRHDNN